jgi:Protein of unknown function (DUF642)
MGRRLSLIVVMAAAVTLGTTTAAGAHTNVLKDGSFETPQVQPPFETFEGFVGPWAVGGTVDVVTDTLAAQPTRSGWQAAKGSQSLDLNGGGTGAVWQDVPTTPGAQYVVRYSFAGNPLSRCGPVVKRFAVVWDGVVVAVNRFDTTGHTFAHMGWVTRRHRVTATGSTSRLAFESLTTTGFCGPALDLVRVTPVA